MQCELITDISLSVQMLAQLVNINCIKDKFEFEIFQLYNVPLFAYLKKKHL